MTPTKSSSPREYHVAVDHLDPESGQVLTAYLGTVDQAHVDQMRAIAEMDDTGRVLREHPRQPGAFMVLRDDGGLDVYVPTDAEPYEVRDPDPNPRPREDAEGQGDGGEEPGTPRGASAPTYVQGAVRFGGQAIGGAMDHPESGPRVTWHTTESPAGAPYFYSVAAYLIRAGAEPQVIYDPESDLLGQFGPLHLSARALRNDSARRTNREGKVNIQVEVLGRASKPWTSGFDPAKKPNYRSLIAAARAWGVPDTWPAGKPAGSASAAKRPRSTWQTKGGHYAHSQVPGNDHWDPGAIDTAKVPGRLTSTQDSGNGGGSTTETYTVRAGDTLSRIARKHGTTVNELVEMNNLVDPNALRVGQRLRVPKAPVPDRPRYQPYPGREFFHAGRRSPIITAMGRRLVAEGCSAYAQGPGPSWTRADERSYAEWQRKCGYEGGDADGIPGKKTWDLLKIPHL